MEMTMMKTRTLLIALLGLAAVVPAFAQTQLGTVTGAVKDEQGGALPGVTITLTGKTGSRTTTTDTKGEYRFPAIAPGLYEVKAEMSGFRSKRIGSVDVPVASVANVDLNLSVGGVSETVDVVGEATLVDTTSAASNNTLSQDILYNMPIDRRSFNIYNFAPGISHAAAFGAGANTANARLLDGVDTRDPDGGTDWTFYNYNIMDQVQIQGLGAPAEYGGYTGAIVNTISKSGGNRYAGLFDLNYTKKGDFFLTGDNIPASVKSANPTLANPSVTKKYLDVTAQISGPLKQDKAFFFFSVQRFLKDEDPTGPRTSREEISHRGNLKINWNPGPKDQLITAVQFDDYNIRGRCDLSSDFLCRDELTDNEDAPEWVWNTQWHHLFSSTTFLEAKYVGWWGYYYLDPQVNKPGHLDGETGGYSQSYGAYSYYDRARHQVNASITHYADAFGKHDLKFGVEVERSRARNRYGYVDNIFYYDYGGQPYQAYSYSYDQEGYNHRESFYAQDAWKVNDRLTINAGVRFDWVRGISSALGQKVYDTKSVGPRLGLAFDVAGDHKTVLKGTFGQYYEGASFEHYIAAVPGIHDFVVYDNTTAGRPEVDRTTTPVYRVDPNIKKPRVDEFTAGFERALGNDFRIQATGIYRKYRSYSDRVFPSARWTPVTVTNQLTSQPVTVYKWANRADSETDGLVTNTDGFHYLDAAGNVLGTARTYRDYKGLMFSLTKRFTNRWQAQVSYVLSRSRGTWNNDNSNSYGASFRWASPTTALINTDGRTTNDPTHEVKAYLSYNVPKVDLQVNAYYRYITGQAYTPFQQLSSSSLSFPQSSRGRRLLLEPRGSRRLDNENVLDLRVEKLFKLGAGSDRVSVYADLKNLFNKSVITSVNERYPSVSSIAPDGSSTSIPFAGATGIIAPRQLILGARWSF